MDEQSFWHKFPILKDFLAGFVIQCYEPVSDERVINENSLGALKCVLPQAHEVLQLDPFPAEIIESITNIWHEDISTKDWFASIVSKIEVRVNEAQK